MDVIFQGITKIFQLFTGGSSDVLQISMFTLKISVTATVISMLCGIPFGLWLALKNFPGKQMISSLVNFGMGLPPVVIGLLVTLFLWRYGPLGKYELMYTPTAIIIVQTIIAIPIIAGLSFSAIASLNPKLRWQLLSLGATPWQTNWLLIKEARLGLMAAVIAGFGRIISEVGASMMVGGNIKGETRILTTAIVTEVGKGNYDLAVAIGFILLFITYGIVALLTLLQQGGKSEIGGSKK